MTQCESCKAVIKEQQKIAGLCLPCVDRIFEKQIIEEYILAYASWTGEDWSQPEADTYHLLYLVPGPKNKWLVLVEKSVLKDYWKGSSCVSIVGTKFFHPVCKRNDYESINDWINRGKSLINLPMIKRLKIAHQLK